MLGGMVCQTTNSFRDEFFLVDHKASVETNPV